MRNLVTILIRHCIVTSTLNTRLAQRSPLGKNAESYLRLINAHYPMGKCAVGQTLKMIE
jgi:hypothetical protein